nr:hypothetical protein [Moraxella sp. CTOTU47616]
MKILKSDEYTLYINGSSVTMSHNQNKMPYSLSNLYISTYDVLFYVATQSLSNDDRAERIKQLIIDTHLDNLDRLNKITCQNFIAA